MQSRADSQAAHRLSFLPVFLASMSSREGSWQVTDGRVDWIGTSLISGTLQASTRNSLRLGSNVGLSPMSFSRCERCRGILQLLWCSATCLCQMQSPPEMPEQRGLLTTMPTAARPNGMLASLAVCTACSLIAVRASSSAIVSSSSTAFS